MCTGCLAQARRACRWGGLVFKADRLCSSLNSRRESNEEEEDDTIQFRGGLVLKIRRYNLVPRRARMVSTGCLAQARRALKGGGCRSLPLPPGVSSATRSLISEEGRTPPYGVRGSCSTGWSGAGVRQSGYDIQGYLAHKKPPSPLRPFTATSSRGVLCHTVGCEGFIRSNLGV